MKFLNVLKVCQKLENKRYDEGIQEINNWYTPYTCLDLILQIKEEIFSAEDFYKVKRKKDEKEYNLNLSPKNLMLVKNKPTQTIEIEGIKYKTNFPNILSFNDDEINACSIIKQIQVKNEWYDIESHNINEVSQLADNLSLDTYKQIVTHYNNYIKDIETFDYLKINDINEKLNFNILVQFVIDNFNYKGDNLRELQMSLMRHFNFCYQDFENIELKEVLKLIKIGNAIVKEENEINKGNE